MTDSSDPDDYTKKPSHELQKIVDEYVPSYLARIKAQKEIFRRQELMEKENATIQKSIRSMTRMILWLTIVAVFLGLVALLR